MIQIRTKRISGLEFRNLDHRSRTKFVVTWPQDAGASVDLSRPHNVRKIRQKQREQGLELSNKQQTFCIITHVHLSKFGGRFSTKLKVSATLQVSYISFQIFLHIRKQILSDWILKEQWHTVFCWFDKIRDLSVFKN